MSSKPSWPSKPPSNIIVRMPNWLGDLVMATPVLADIRDKWKNAEITVMCQQNVAPMLENNPHINEVLRFKQPSGWLHRKQHSDIIQSVRHGEYDLGILLTNSLSSAWWFWRGRVKNRIGYAANLRGCLLNRAVPFPKEREIQHLVLTYKMLLEPMGIPISDTPPQLFVSPEEKKEALELFQRCGIDPSRHKIIGINPGAAFGSAKCWLPDRFEGVTKRLLEDPNTYILYFGDQIGAPLVNDICKNFSERVINLAGRTTIRQLIALIDSCTAFLTNDSGPMHIAAALGTPLLALFGSTNEVKTGPFPAGKVIHKHVECSPCYKRTCPIDFRCMTRIEVNEVYNELQKIIDDQTPRTKARA